MSQDIDAGAPVDEQAAMEEWVASTHAYALAQADSDNHDEAITSWQSILDQGVIDDDSAKEIHWNIGIMMLAKGQEVAAGEYLSSHGWPQDTLDKAKDDGAPPA